MFELRPRTAADLDALVEWVPDPAALYLFTGPRLRWPLTTVQLAEMEALAGFSAWMLVDEESGVAVGHVDVVLDGRNARLGRVLIDPDRRGHGLAHVLVEGAVARARAQGASQVRLSVVAGNEPALRVYRRAGFELEDGGGRPDMLAMILAL